MLASLTDAPLADPQLVYEPKYDGIRAIAEIGGRGTPVHLWSRLGNEKTRQFPDVVEALEAWGRTLTRPLVLDGEIVALDQEGRPAGFQQLQGRIHVSAVDEDAVAGGGRAAFIAFDLLRDGATDLRSQPLLERRAALEALFVSGPPGPSIRLSEMVRGDGRALYKRAFD